MLPHLYVKRHLDCIVIENKDQQWIEKAVMAFLKKYVYFWKYMNDLCYSIVLYVDRSRKYTFYLETEFFCNEIQNLADYGWFLENLG